MSRQSICPVGHAGRVPAEYPATLTLLICAGNRCGLRLFPFPPENKKMGKVHFDSRSHRLRDSGKFRPVVNCSCLQYMVDLT